MGPGALRICVNLSLGWDSTVTPQQYAQAMTAANVWYRVLRELGHEVSVDDVGDLSWVDEGIRFYCIVEPDDSRYLRLMIPMVWHDESPSRGALARASDLVHQVNGEVKVAKLILGPNGVHASAEAFYPTPEIASRHVHDLTMMLRVAAHLFSERFFAGEEEATDNEPDVPEPWRGA